MNHSWYSAVVLANLYMIIIILVVATEAEVASKKSMEKSMTTMFMALALRICLAYFVGHWNRNRTLHPGHLKAPLVGHRVALLVVSMPVALLDIVRLTFLIMIGFALFPVICLVVYHVLGVTPLICVAVSVIMVEETPAASTKKAEDCECEDDR